MKENILLPATYDCMFKALMLNETILKGVNKYNNWNTT